MRLLVQFLRGGFWELLHINEILIEEVLFTLLLFEKLGRAVLYIAAAISASDLVYILTTEVNL